jgi:hypothetical protein
LDSSTFGTTQNTKSSILVATLDRQTMVTLAATDYLNQKIKVGQILLREES